MPTTKSDKPEGKSAAVGVRADAESKQDTEKAETAEPAEGEANEREDIENEGVEPSKAKRRIGRVRERSVKGPGAGGGPQPRARGVKVTAPATPTMNPANGKRNHSAAKRKSLRTTRTSWTPRTVTRPRPQYPTMPTSKSDNRRGRADTRSNAASVGRGWWCTGCFPVWRWYWLGPRAF